MVPATRKIVIPANAGIQFIGNGLAGTSAFLDPRVRGDDEGFCYSLFRVREDSGRFPVAGTMTKALDSLPGPHAAYLRIAGIRYRSRRKALLPACWAQP